MIRYLTMIAAMTIYFFVITSLGSEANALVEWSDISPTQGKYSQIYFDYSGTTFYVLNDWAVNRDDGGVDGGLKAGEYNSFTFAIGGTSYEIRIYRDGSHDIFGGVLNNFQSATGWATSPNEATKHTIWEFKFDVAPTRIANFNPHDPIGGGLAPFNPPTLVGVSTGSSAIPHVIDGAFTDFSIPELPPTPSRSFQSPVGDPWFPESGFLTLNLLPGGGVQVVPVPEPSTILLLGAGLTGLVLSGRKRLFRSR